MSDHKQNSIVCYVDLSQLQLKTELFQHIWHDSTSPFQLILRSESLDASRADMDNIGGVTGNLPEFGFETKHVLCAGK